MVISKKPNLPGDLLIEGRVIERVKQYTYLGTNINEDWDHLKEIWCCIKKARVAFTKMSKVFKTHNLPLETKMRLLRCYVFSVLFYGVEAWTLTEGSAKKREAFEMWLYRRILRVSWKDKVTNIKILRRMNKEREVLNNVKIRKTSIPWTYNEK